MLPATDPLPARIDITQPPYKAIPGTDCAPAFQAACDDCRADGRPHVIYIPGNAAPYLLNQPIFADADNLAFVGDGERLSVIRVNGQCFPDALQFGVRQTSIKVTASGMHIDQTLTPVSDFWIDASQTLDNSAGQRYGLRTRGLAYGYFQGTPFDMGPLGPVNWSGTRQLTLDFVILNPAGWFGGDQGIRLFGAGSPDAQTPSPFYCSVDGSSASISFVFATDDGVVRRASFTLPAPDTQVQRIAIQLDLTAPAVLAYVNGTQVQVLLAGIGPGWIPGLTLRANDYCEFQLGTCLVDALFNPGNITDQTVFGFKLTGAPLYRDNGSGAAQVRLDGAALNDARQFFQSESAFHALLPLKDSGNDCRRIPWQGAQAGGAGFGAGTGLFLHDSSLGVTDTRAGNTVRDLTLMANPDPTGYGRALCHGPIYDFKAQDCIFHSGAHNFGALNGAVGYPLKVRDCEFDYATDAAIYAQGNMWWGERLTLKYWGREAIRSLGSFLDLRQVFYTPDGFHECVLKLHNSPGGVLDNHNMDFENGGPVLAHVYCEAGADSGPTHLTLRNVTFGTHAAGVNYIVLLGPDAPNAHYAPATLLLENTQHVGFGSIPGIWTLKER